MLLCQNLNFGFMNIKKIYWLPVLAFLYACGGTTNTDAALNDEEQEAQKKLEMYEAVIEVHNEVMPKMEDLYQYRQLADQRLDSVGEDSEDAEAIKNLVGDLESAEEGMMQWMRQFRRPNDSLGFEQIIKYYELEMERVTLVQDSVLNGISRAKQYFD